MHGESKRVSSTSGKHSHPPPNVAEPPRPVTQPGFVVGAERKEVCRCCPKGRHRTDRVSYGVGGSGPGGVPISCWAASNPANTSTTRTPMTRTETTAMSATMMPYSLPPRPNSSFGPHRRVIVRAGEGSAQLPERVLVRVARAGGEELAFTHQHHVAVAVRPVTAGLYRYPIQIGDAGQAK